METQRAMNPQARAHIVLIPGFAGFDALGQINYYAGTSRVFYEWLEAQAPSSSGRRTVLHYFDNLPSGAVATRAAKLHSYLAKRIVRNEFAPGDTIALVGHSTGGLDIRHLLMDLAKPGEIRVDGSVRDSLRVDNAELLGMIQRVVFLSTPHYGSNIADDWVGETPWVSRALALGELLFAATRLIPGRRLRSLLGPKPDLDAWYAIQDAVLESQDRDVEDPAKAADAREAFSQLALWISQMSHDFSVLKDLATEKNAQKAEEHWPTRVAARSYATVSPPAELDLKGFFMQFVPFLRAPTQTAADVLYQLVYSMTSTGDFVRRSPIGESWFTRPLGEAPVIDDAANDGIVNTASMFWKHGGPTQLVLADHGDIIGHYRRNPEEHRTTPDSPRRFESYDFFKSGSKFSEATFKAVWNDIYTFCSQSLDASADEPEARRSA